MKPVDEQVALLMHGAEFGDPQLKARMSKALHERLVTAQREGRPLRVYCGYDATGPHLHLGHTVTLRRLRLFQELGHDVTVLIGTFTASIGDASDRESARTPPSEAAIRAHAQGYIEQVNLLLDPERTTYRYNADWLDQLSFRDMIAFGSLFTAQQLLSRDNFSKRYKSGDPVWLRELLYPLAQGYDAVALKADVQIGATEQLFNLMAGRKLQEHFGQQPQVVITYPILVGTDGTLRMSKSTGNYIGISEPPEVQYGKVMSLPDSAMDAYIDLVTGWSLDRIRQVKAAVKSGKLHPMEAKQALAWDVVAGFHGAQQANAAAAHFAQVHQRRETPDQMPEFPLSSPATIVDVLCDCGLAQSRGEAKRLVRQAGVRLNDTPITDVNAVVPESAVLQVGKRRFVRLIGADD